MSAEENKARFRRVLDIINTGNLDQADDLIASDYVYRSPGSPEMRGVQGFKDLISTYLTAFPDMKMDLDDLLADGDKVVARWTATGTHRGELMGIPPTGKRVTTTGMIITRFAGGKVVEDNEVIDMLGVLQQLGVVPAGEQASA